MKTTESLREYMHESFTGNAPEGFVRAIKAGYLNCLKHLADWYKDRELWADSAVAIMGYAAYSGEPLAPFRLITLGDVLFIPNVTDEAGRNPNPLAAVVDPPANSIEISRFTPREVTSISFTNGDQCAYDKLPGGIILTGTIRRVTDKSVVVAEPGRSYRRKHVKFSRFAALNHDFDQDKIVEENLGRFTSDGRRFVS